MPFTLAPVIPPGTFSSAPQPVLPTASGELLLRPAQPADAQAVFEAFQDPVLQYWHIRTMDSLDEAHAWIEQVHRGWAEETAAQWIVARADDDAALGRMALRTMDLTEGVAEVAYWVLPGARGLGVAPRALATVTRWALDAGFHRLDLLHSTGNAPSCRVAEKTGYALEGTRRSSALHADGWHDMHTHVRIADDPASGRPAPHDVPRDVPHDTKVPHKRS
ncbi:GNAT family N-acetyltransferase [Streptomyces sp. SID5785]|uniref:GNAT family N-acetyltransferase n=1 Tax=Streptomyces sp. SID5785 TaxID=2690309 RepID=UPI001361406C|nr:GNAT family N-acetyltransferase [Streptomyces sp. SID5785]MZD05306.1 GNAT family N-acetyltransferase [Streptomyces sp. SID5785]